MSGPHVVVVGAGAGGLSAAERLLEVHATVRVTVLEARDELGGACRSRPDPDGVLHDLGAIALPPGADGGVLGLADALGVPTSPVEEERVVDPHGRPVRSVVSARTWLRYLWRRKRGPIPPTSTETWLADLPGLAEALTPGLACMGYGTPAQVPASYTARYVSPALVRSRVASRVSGRFAMRSVDGGMQRLWQALADRLAATGRVRIQLGTRVRTLREGPLVEVDGPLACDAVLFTASPEALLSVLDGPREALARAVRSHPYATRLATVHGLDTSLRQGALYVPERACSGEDGALCMLTRRRADAPYAVLYSLGTGDGPLRADLGALGLALGPVHHVVHWRAFPHVPVEALAQGWRARWMALQGRGGLWFSTSVTSFSTLPAVRTRAREVAAQLAAAL